MDQREDALEYDRISSKKQDDGFSLDAQGRLGQDYADRRNLRIVKTWKVIESAWNKKNERVAFNQVIEYAKAHPKIKHIIFDITDRMTRNDIDKIKINDLIHNHGKIIHFARSNKIYDKSSSPDDIFMLDIEVAVAKKMSNDISRKVKMGMQEKADQGFYPSISPLGYINNRQTRLIDINPVQAPHLRVAFQMMATGNYSLEMIVKHLDSVGFRTNTGARIRKSSLAHALKNPFYYGVFVWNSKQIQGTHEPLIDKATFDRVQLVLSGKRHPHIHRKDFPFNNFFTCDICDCTILGEEKRKANSNRYVYYHCSFSKGRHENGPYIPPNRLAEIMAEPVKQVSDITLEMAA
ncbi:MAG: recombinase family protein [Candidatus Omnitrophica bacterium]|nr:recombinase family protein [Candidatus Omnitrophota bacterium]